MPNRDATGPMGMGSRTGRGMGPCGGGSRGRGRFYDFGLGFGIRRFFSTSKEDRKKILEEDLQEIKKELEDLNK